MAVRVLHCWQLTATRVRVLRGIVRVDECTGGDERDGADAGQAGPRRSPQADPGFLRALDAVLVLFHLDDVDTGDGQRGVIRAHPATQLSLHHTRVLVTFGVAEGEVRPARRPSPDGRRRF